MRVFSFAQESTRYCNYSKDKFNEEITFEIIDPTDEVSCKYCKKRFRKSETEYIQITNSQYAHVSCAELESKREKTDAEKLDDYIMKLFRYYLLVGGLPDAVNKFVESRNMVVVRTIQRDVHELYGIDASQYDAENSLKIRRIYDLVPSNLENKKKRVRVKDIENKKGKQFSDYADEFEYLMHSGISLGVSAISNPRFPLIESSVKDLLKL